MEDEMGTQHEWGRGMHIELWWESRKRLIARSRCRWKDNAEMEKYKPE
jgi:hypothetical protein